MSEDGAIGCQNGIAASLATKKGRPASEASKTSAWAIGAVTWDSGISLCRVAAFARLLKIADVLKGLCGIIDTYFRGMALFVSKLVDSHRQKLDAFH